jgi:holo-[acyl-carrier protein] synthase
LGKDSKGAPLFVLTDKAQTHFGLENRSLSISHDGGFALAVVAVTFLK